ncbi:MAG TPA: hypothetical protein VMS74_02915 [Acidimicrobiia bacterium]|nr:hypothetical protein [Acidimicrobiia bacterium]
MTAPSDEQRFFDTRAAYTMFVHATDEKKVVADRLGREVDHLIIGQPGLRVFDAGMGDASVLDHLMRRIHVDEPHIPWLVVAKEISIEDVRQALMRLPDRFIEHPELVFVVTNMKFSEAPSLRPADGGEVRWTEVELEGRTSHEFSTQIRSLFDTLADDWQVDTSGVTGNPVHRHPSVLVLYRQDRRFILQSTIPRPEGHDAGYDLIVMSQAYRAKTAVDRKVRLVLVPLARALAPRGRLIGIQSYGGDPGGEIIQGVWPDEVPFPYGRHEIVDEARKQLGEEEFEFHALDDEQSIFDYSMHTMPSQEMEHIGTSSLVAAFSSAAYVAQIDERRLSEAMATGSYLDVTRKVIEAHGGVWFRDESFLITRRP